MSVSKTWAYVGQFGRDRRTAWALKQERAKYGGKPLGRKYWSWHKPGQRKPVKHVQKGHSTFFAYINPGDAAHGGGGESLSHRLFKDAISGLSATRLHLGQHGEHDITISHGETEKAIVTPEGPYYADVYLRFTSTTPLGLRWSSEIYIEVHHTHAVPVDKQKALSRMGVPVVEVKLPKMFEYLIKDEKTTDSLEEEHVNRIRKVIQSGFLAGRVISDRRSIEFLEQEISRLQAEAQAARGSHAATERAKAEAVDQLKSATRRVVQLEDLTAEQAQRVKGWVDKVQGLESILAAERKVAVQIGDKLKEANATIKASKSEKRTARRWIVAAAVLCMLLIGLCAYLGYQCLLLKQMVARASPQAVPTAPVAQVATPTQPGPVRHKATSATHRH